VEAAYLVLLILAFLVIAGACGYVVARLSSGSR
jgi:hypothetical protein